MHMSRFFGEIRQAGYVVDDIEKAMDYWSRDARHRAVVL